MLKSAQLVDELTDSENEAQDEQRGKESRAGERTSNFATLDNDTVVEVFKHLNYGQLAMSSLVSKRFWNMIRTHRHKLALLYVDSIQMSTLCKSHTLIKIFDKEYSIEEYNEWAVLNGYSKQIPLESQLVGLQSTQNERKVFQLSAYADYKGRATFNLYLSCKISNK